jgi:hypothetical protein
MNFLDVKTLEELKGKEVETLEESEMVHFLTLKAY